MNSIDLRQLSIPGLALEKKADENIKIQKAYIGLIRNFFCHGKRYKSDIKSTLQLADFTALYQKIHSLRGVSAAIGALKLNRSCSDLMQELNNDHLPLEIIANVFHELDHLLASIENSGIISATHQEFNKQQQQVSPLNALSLIIIEDDKVFSNFLRESFVDHFKMIYKFSSYQDGFNYFIRETVTEPLIVIIDENLPDGSGSDLAENILKRHSNIFVILISGENILLEKSLNNCMVLLKPFLIKDLHKVLEGIAFNLFSQIHRLSST